MRDVILFLLLCVIGLLTLAIRWIQTHKIDKSAVEDDRPSCPPAWDRHRQTWRRASLR
jgi:hypothetical protein